MKQIKELLHECHTGELHAIEDLLLRAVEYVRADAVEQILQLNIAETGHVCSNEEIVRAKRESTVSYNGFVYAVNIVNRICIKHQIPVIYQGKDDCRSYTELAMHLVEETLLGEKQT